jgi:hypothetical protein
VQTWFFTRRNRTPVTAGAPLECAGYNSDVITRAEWDVRRQQWAEYRRWAQAEAPAEHSPEHSIADVGTILEWIPAAVRSEERDPGKLSVQRMHFLLGLVNPAPVKS